MNRTTKVIVSVALAVIVAAGGFIAGYVVARADTAFTESPAAVSLGIAKSDMESKVTEVYNLLGAEALAPPSESSATAGAVQGLLGSNGDKYAMYFDPTHFQAFNEMTNGAFGGIGVVLGEKQGQAYVVEVYKDTPADRAGMKAGDIFHSIEGTTQAKWTSDEVVKLVRGDAGTVVHLGMTRPSTDPRKPAQELRFVIVRAVINVPNTKTQMYGKVGYIRLGQFTAKSANDMEKAVDEVTSKGAKAIVVDLRENPGGLLDQAVDLTSLFVSQGVIVRIDQRNLPEDIHYATGHKITDLPLVVLIDNNSASASEITAGALQDYGRATLIGEQSYGKGSVQTIVKLTDGSGVKFTIAHYLTPKKRAINGVGLTPDIVVTMDPMKQLDPKTDVQLTRAIAVANSKIH
jgi:carboxyl-terminal processing protease